MATSDFGLSSFLDTVPQVDLGGLFPSNPLTPQARQQPLIPNAPTAQTALSKKYSTYMQTLRGQYDPVLIQSMMDYDSQRVRNGQAPLGEAETRSALEAARTQTQTTPEPKRGIGPLDVLKNAVQDVGNIVSSIPRIPSALIHEGEQLGQIGGALQQGPNPVAGLLRAPGIRLLPGAYTAGNIAAGEPGEIFRHPVQTLLDVLPGAEAVAKLSPVARAVEGLVEPARMTGDTLTLSTREFRKLDRMQERPISTTIMNRVGPEGGIVRSNAGEFMDVVRSSKIGKFLTGRFGIDARDAAALLNGETGKLDAVLQGKIQPRTDLEAIGKVAHDFRSTLEQMDPSVLAPGRISAIYDAAINDRWDGLSDPELAAAQAYRTKVLEPLTDWALRNGKNVEFGGEIYDKPTGTMLLERQRNLQMMQTTNRIRNAMVSGDHLDAINALVDRLNMPGKLPGQRGRLSVEQRLASVKAGEVSARELLLAWRGTRQSIRNAGYDTTILDNLAKGQGKNIATTEFVQAIKDLHAGRIELPLQPTMSLDQILEQARAEMGDGSVGYRDLVRGVQLGEWKGVTRALDNLRGTDPAFLRGIRNARDTAKLMDNAAYKVATEDGIAKAEQAMQSLKTRNLSARFLPKQREITRGLVAQRLIDNQLYLPVEDQVSVERIIAARDAGELSDIPGFSPTMYASAQREAAQTIMRMKEAGFDPVFIHTVTPNRIESSLRFGENIVHRTEASTRARVMEGAPGIKDMSIAANDMAMQFLDEPLREMQLHMLADQFGYSQAEVNVMEHETARWRAGKSEVLDYEGHKQKVINERWMQLNPDELGMQWGSPYLNKLKTDKVFVPREIGQQLKEMTQSKPMLGGLLDPTTKLFRISTTALSLRTQIYNLVGGPISATLLHPNALGYARDAIEMLRDPSRIPEEMQAVIGSNVRTMHQLDDIAKGKVVEGVRKYMVGEKMRKWWDTVQENKTVGNDLTHRFGGKFTGLVEKSYQLNGMVDDFTRLITYMAEYDKGISKGWTHEYAAYRGVGLARKVLQDFLGQTPFERNIMKSILPFYGFISHAMRFVMRYPLDHPLRAEFMAKLAEAELEDSNQGLPSRFMAMLFFGKPSATGDQHALNLGPFNPFGDIANSMTLAGFLGNTNPILQTAFEMVGLQRGTSELYPSLRYDPQTGRMEAIHPGLVESLVGNIIPSSTGILAMMGMNKEYNDILRRDPEAAGRYMLSSLTLPTIERQYNVPQEQFAAELARQKSADSALANALKSGDWSEAMRYPSLVKYLDAVSHIAPDTLQSFVPQSKQQVMTIAQQAYAGQPPALPKVQPLSALVAAQQGQIGLASGAPPVSGLAVGGALGLNGV